MSASYPVTGRQGTGIFPRYEIEELQKKQPRQFSLFILSYLVLQGRGDAYVAAVKAVIPGFQFTIPTVPEAAQFSHVAGVHGLPFEEWLGDQRTGEDSKGDYLPGDVKDTKPVPSRFGGYCNHGSVLFPHWHRPYVMLIEQAIGDVAVKIAEQFMSASITVQGKAVWKKAAQELRFPFWDWADAKVLTAGMPRALTDDTIEITVANDYPTTAINPLSFFPFTAIPDGFRDVDDGDEGISYFSDWNRTLRYPISNPNANTSNTDEMNATIKDRAKQVRCSTSDLFTFNGSGNPKLTWDEFSNHSAQSLREIDFYNVQSLEGVHDTMHDVMGGIGHVGNPNYAGFDPIFYLHHCQVDRLLAFWEVLYPDYYFGDGIYTVKDRKHRFIQSTGTYALVYSDGVDGDTPLAPFHENKERYWTANTARYLGGKYYTYPPVAGVDLNNVGDLAKARKALQDYYGVDAPAKLSTGIKLETPTPGHGYHVVENFRRLVLIVKAPEFSFNGPFGVEVHHEYQEEKILIGKISIFARPNGSSCAGCAVRRDNGSTIRGVIPVPGDVFLSIAHEKATDSEEISGIDLVAHRLKTGLHVTIINSEGKKVGGTSQKGALADLVNDYDIDIAIVSSAARRKGPEGPVEWFDFKGHKVSDD